MFARPETGELPPVIRTSDWTSHFSALIAAQIAESRLADLKETAAFISRADNRPGLCGDRDCTLPDLIDDPDVLVYFYLKDIPTFAANAEMIERLLELDRQSAQILAKYAGGADEQNGLGDILNSPMIEQIAFGVASCLEEKVSHPNDRT
jgi:hypothetical protein